MLILLIFLVAISTGEEFILKKSKFIHGITNFNSDDHSQLWFNDDRSHNDAEGTLILDEKLAHLDVKSSRFNFRCKLSYSQAPNKFRKENYNHLNGLWEEIYSLSWTWLIANNCESNFDFNSTNDIRVGFGANGKNKNFGLRFEFEINGGYGSLQADLVSKEDFELSGKDGTTTTTYKGVGKNECYQNYQNCYKNKVVGSLLYSYKGKELKTSLFKFLENYVLVSNGLEPLNNGDENNIQNIHYKPKWSLDSSSFQLEDVGFTVTVDNDGNVNFGASFSTPFGPVNVDKSKLDLLNNIFKPSPCLEKKLLCYRTNIDCLEVCKWEANISYKEIVDESRCRCYTLDNAFIRNVCFPHVCCFAKYNSTCEFSCTKHGIPCKN